MIFLLIRKLVLIAAAAALCRLAAGELGPWGGVGAWAGAMAVSCIAAALLLRSAAVGEIGWRNYLAGYALPWGYAIARGRLWGIAFTSWAVWVLVGAAAVFLWPPNGSEPPPGPAAASAPGAEGPGPATTALLFAAWLIDGAIILYALGTALGKLDPSSRAARSLFKLAAFAAALIAGSAVLWTHGLPGWALLVAGGPPGAVTGIYGLFLGAILTLGRNMRWN